MTEPTPVPSATVSAALEAMLTRYADALNLDPGLTVQVSIARKLAGRVDSETDGSKLSALVIRLRQVVDALGVAAPDTDVFDEIAARRREHEQAGYRPTGSGDAESAGLSEA